MWPFAFPFELNSVFSVVFVATTMKQGTRTNNISD
jgi:hypothetical protein